MAAVDPQVARRPWWRRAYSWRTGPWWLLCSLASLTSLSVSELGARSQGDAIDDLDLLRLLLGFAAAFLAPALLGWRERWPVGVTLATTAAAVVTPIGTWTALVALGSLISRRRGPQVWWTTGAVAATTLLTTVLDARGPTTSTSLLKNVFSPTGTPLGTPLTLDWWVAPLAATLGVGIAVGLGLMVRARRDAATATARSDAAEQATQRLGDELARQRERALIGQEVHDALGHRLSVLNLHAGALEVNAPADSDLAASARLIRETATGAMGDLRSLLSLLDDRDGAALRLPEKSLADLQSVVDDTVRTGTPVSSSIFLEQAADADPTLSRAVYRVVQEVLTNAHRHAPGHPIRLSVTGGPATGVRIDARNPYVPVAGSGGGGQGLRGMSARAELLGGTLRYGLDEGGRTFRVTVDLPWSPARR